MLKNIVLELIKLLRILSGFPFLEVLISLLYLKPISAFLLNIFYESSFSGLYSFGLSCLFLEI